MVRRTLTSTATAFTAAATLLLTACGGGGDDKGSDDIKGADISGSPSASTSASTSASAAAGGSGPDLGLPEDFKLVFDFDKPSEATRAGALGGAENYIRALNHGIDQQDPNDPAYRYYSLNQAASYAKSQIETWKKGGWTVTGTDRYYNDEVTTLRGGQGVLVQFCRNQAKFYGKEIKTGKILYTKESLSSYQTFRLRMIPPTGSSKVWRAFTIEVIGKAKECR
ncbi:hypothetical protein ACYF6T_34370 [Streptomyces sp. 7R007]